MKCKTSAMMPYNTHQFTSPDSIIPDHYNPRSWNRYAYVNNNPVRYNDPSGHKLMDTHDGECDLDCVWRGYELSENGKDFVWTGSSNPFPDINGKASNLRDLMHLGDIHAAHGTIIGAGLQSLKDDPSVQAAQNGIIEQISSYPEYGKEVFLLENGPLEDFTTNGFSRKWYVAALTGNKAFYMVHTATLQATKVRVSESGYISLTWKVDDHFDYTPDWEGHGLAYNLFAEIVHFFYNDIGGAKETYPTNAYWNDTIPPVR